jgi:DNA-binding CsgD family transcriptional regulator
MNNVQTLNKYVPDYLLTPGEVLENYLGYAGITQDALADRTGLSKNNKRNNKGKVRHYCGSGIKI